MVRQQPNDVASHPGKELGVRHDLGAGRLAILVVEENQIDVGAVVQLLPAQFSQPQNDKPRGCPPCRHRHAKSALGATPCQPNRRLDARVGQVREVLSDHFQRITTDDVVVANPQALPLTEPA